MFISEFSRPKLVSIPNFSSISLQMADFSIFLGAKSCKAPSVSHFGTAEQKQEVDVFCSPPPPPGKIGLKKTSSKLNSSK